MLVALHPHRDQRVGGKSGACAGVGLSAVLAGERDLLLALKERLDLLLHMYAPQDSTRKQTHSHTLLLLLSLAHTRTLSIGKKEEKKRGNTKQQQAMLLRLIHLLSWV